MGAKCCKLHPPSRAGVTPSSGQLGCGLPGAELTEARLRDSAPGLKFSLQAFTQLSALETSPKRARAGDTFDVPATFRSGRELGGVLALPSRAPPLGRQLCTALRFPPMRPALFFDQLGLVPALL